MSAKLVRFPAVVSEVTTSMVATDLRALADRVEKGDYGKDVCRVLYVVVSSNVTVGHTGASPGVHQLVGELEHAKTAVLTHFV